MRLPSYGFYRKFLILFAIVISVAGIITCVVIISRYRAQHAPARRDAARIAGIERLEQALTSYLSSKGEFPEVLSELVSSGIIAEVPHDPLDASEYFYQSYAARADSDPAQNSTIKKCKEATQVCSFYHLGVNLEEASNAVLMHDQDLVSNAINGSDTAGCSQKKKVTSRHCYDVIPDIAHVAP